MAAISFFFYFLIFSFSKATANGGGRHGFTTTLFHRDSPLSPLYNSSLSPYDRLANAVGRSISRSAALLHRTAAAAAGIQSPVIYSGGEFLMSISIGTPPVNVIAIADTGSDLTWTQCLPCEECFNQSLPIFDPRQSSSFRHVSCTSDACDSIEETICEPDSQTCTYEYTYGDRSYTNGDLASDKITIGSLQLPDTIFGCGHNNGGVFAGDASGIVGLNGGYLSFLTQMTKIASIPPKFSYCLPYFVGGKNVTGKINFGQDAVVSGSEVVSTPLVPNSLDNSYYFTTLEAISIGNKRFEFVPNDMSGKGNILIDSGTTLTFIPKNLYDDVVSTLKSVVKAKPVKDPAGFFELCYADVVSIIPVITAHFGGGADVNLLALNTFVMVANNVSCLALAPTRATAIFGNLAQMNFLIGYDLQKKTLSFKPTICS